MKEKKSKEKILLALLPFWDPQIPPLGIACLKSFLNKYCYRVKTVDANLKMEFRELYDRYYEALKKCIPGNRQGNIFNIGNQVLRNHLMAYLNAVDADAAKYNQLIKILDLSTADAPDFSDFDLRYYPHLAHYGGRSCPYQCKFCSETINWGKYRKKDVHQTVKECIELYRRHSYQLFLMTDSTLNPIITGISHAFIKSGVTIYWDGFLRADRHVCNEKNTLLWRRGGFYRAKLGLESGSQRVLDLMNKRITTRQCETALAALAYSGIKTTTFWLFGFPGETEEDFQMTLDFIGKCKNNIYEADCNAFNYYLTGQSNSEERLKNNKGVLLYPQWAKRMLVTQTWTLDGEPSREAAYDRLNRFIEHCNQLGIPNPYSLNDVCRADERWKKLHKNAVPPIVKLRNRDVYVDESKHVKGLCLAENKLEDDDNWF